MPVLLGELPFGWNTNAAAMVMQADRWDAGSALMQANQDAIAACQQVAGNQGKEQR